MRSMVWTCLCLLFLLSKGEAQFAKFEPPEGKVYHGVGQQDKGVQEYIAAMGDSLQPLVNKIYFDVPGSRPGEYNKLRALLLANKVAGRFVELSIGFQDGNNSTDSLIAESTVYDATIDSIATVCKEYGLRLLVRPGFEFNGSWFGYHPYLYVKAFRKVVDRFTAAGIRDSVAFQWCYYPAGPNDFDAVDSQGARWYPGDDYVDWFGLDLFNNFDFQLSLPDYTQGGQITQKGKSERFLTMAREKNKPVFLSETSAKDINTSPDPQDGLNDWENWFKPFFQFIEAHPEIKGFNYINWNWSTIQTYASWGDARIENNSHILSAYRNELRKPQYLHLKESSITGLNQPAEVPSTFLLFQNYPNPFNPTTYVRVSVPAASFVRLTVVDILGREVARLAESELGQGDHIFAWRADGQASGIYLCRMETPSGILHRLMVLLK